MLSLTHLPRLIYCITTRVTDQIQDRASLPDRPDRLSKA